MADDKGQSDRAYMVGEIVKEIEMSEQISLLAEAWKSDGMAKKKDAVKRKWENAFQKWSDKQGLENTEDYGACGYGSMCDWCKDNDYGRPCVRALNAMCREKRIQIDYSDYNFEKVWRL